MTSSRPRIELAQRAVRDLRRMDGVDRRRIEKALSVLGTGAENADIKPLAGRSPWLRLRAGDWRILYRPLGEQESGDSAGGWLVARVVNRRELERAVRDLNA